MAMVARVDRASELSLIAGGVSPLPLGRRSPRGRRRWYLVQVPEGREQTYCDRVRSIVGAPALEDAFVIRRERWMCRRGRWWTVEEVVHPGYFFAVTSDARELDKALSRLSFPVRLVGEQGSAWAPLAPEAQAWFEAVTDCRHVIRSSTGVLSDGVLRVESGPLVGQESRVSGLDRHKRCCRVRVCDAGDGFAEFVPLSVPSKN